MKLQTTITPRRDGTVRVVGEDGQKYDFKADADGALVCDVKDDATVSKLLAQGDFEPVDEEDFGKALELTRKAAPAADGEDDGEGDDGDDDGDEGSSGGMPVESHTPPATVHKPGVKGVAAKAPAAKKATGKKK